MCTSKMHMGHYQNSALTKCLQIITKNLQPTTCAFAQWCHSSVRKSPRLCLALYGPRSIGPPTTSPSVNSMALKIDRLDFFPHPSTGHRLLVCSTQQCDDKMETSEHRRWFLVGEFWLGLLSCCQTAHWGFLLLWHPYSEQSSLVFFLFWVKRLLGMRHKVRMKRPWEGNSSWACL